jgi:hypothetical protein
MGDKMKFPARENLEGYLSFSEVLNDTLSVLVGNVGSNI